EPGGRIDEAGGILLEIERYEGVGVRTIGMHRPDDRPLRVHRVGEDACRSPRIDDPTAAGMDLCDMDVVVARPEATEQLTLADDASLVKRRAQPQMPVHVEVAVVPDVEVVGPQRAKPAGADGVHALP